MHRACVMAAVGVYAGSDTEGVATLFRVGALLPTGTRDPHAWLPSARAGDRVLELGRSGGIRLSTSRLWSGHSGKEWRLDAGIDVAEELATGEHPVHVIPRGGVGVRVPLAKDVTLAVESPCPLTRSSTVERTCGGAPGSARSTRDGRTFDLR